MCARKGEASSLHLHREPTQGEDLSGSLGGEMEERSPACGRPRPAIMGWEEKRGFKEGRAGQYRRPL